MKSIRIICYFGIYPPTIARNAVLMSGLREHGVEIIECIDQSSGLRKFIRLFQKHWRVRSAYDVVVVGYLSNLVVPLARIISGKPIVYNACNAMYEATVLDRGLPQWSLKALYYWCIDYLSFVCAHHILVESDAQKSFLARTFHIAEHKFIRIWTGADQAVFHPDERIQKRSQFTVVFRGAFLPATGVEYILQAARLLEHTPIHFLILGRGHSLEAIQREAATCKNVKLITRFLPDAELRELLLSSHVVLGQFSNHPRLDRTIQNKTFEALALGMPYITRDSISNRELLRDGQNCLFVQPADPADLAARIQLLFEHPSHATALATQARETYLTICAPRVIARDLLSALTDRGLGK